VGVRTPLGTRDRIPHSFARALALRVLSANLHSNLPYFNPYFLVRPCRHGLFSLDEQALSSSVAWVDAPPMDGARYHVSYRSPTTFNTSLLSYTHSRITLAGVGG